MPLNTSKIVQSFLLSSAEITLDSLGIVRVKYLKGQLIDVAQKKEHHNIFLKITKGVKHPFIFSAESFVNITKEAKEYGIEVEHLQPFLATAIVVDNIAYQLIADFYFKFYKPKTAYKVFKSEERAIEWLNEIKLNPPAFKSKTKSKLQFSDF